MEDHVAFGTKTSLTISPQKNPLLYWCIVVCTKNQKASKTKQERVFITLVTSVKQKGEGERIKAMRSINQSYLCLLYHALRINGYPTHHSERVVEPPFCTTCDIKRLNGGTDRPDNQERRDHVAFGSTTFCAIWPQKPSYYADVSFRIKNQKETKPTTDLLIKAVTSPS